MPLVYQVHLQCDTAKEPGVCLLPPCFRVLGWQLWLSHQVTCTHQLMTVDGALLPEAAYCGHVHGHCWNLGHQYAQSWDTGHQAWHPPQNVYPEEMSHNAQAGNRFPSSPPCACKEIQCHNLPGASLQTKAIAYAVWAYNLSLPSGCALLPKPVDRCNNLSYSQWTHWSMDNSCNCWGAATCSCREVFGFSGINKFLVGKFSLRFPWPPICFLIFTGS